ncbi:MAG: putative Na+/H+ antiporter [Bdellovibrionales bacterium]|nr:putative Na+/H+ antiporter [Bdellovibrionales bacterium]
MTQTIQAFATLCLAAAIAHTFSVRFFLEWAKKTKEKPMLSNLLHLFGEVEVVFGIWAAILILFHGLVEGPERASTFVDRVDFAEPIFVSVILAIACTRPIREFVRRGIEVGSIAISRAFPVVDANRAFYLVALVLGPLLGSLITEPAAMAVCALLLRDRFFEAGVSERFKYKTLALLFVNISIGGVLTHFAAPPVVMVAKVWNWDTAYMFRNFGWKAALAVALNAGVTLHFLREDFARMPKAAALSKKPGAPAWLTAAHVVFVLLCVFSAHHSALLFGIFILFLGFTVVTKPLQEKLQFREALLVGFFLSGLVVLGKAQGWWLTPLITSLSKYPLYFGATILTAFTDNAALTFLGAQVPNLSDALKHALVAGAVTGGGLTLIANAPNPAGYGILKDHFGKNGVSFGRLLVAAIIPTAIASICLEFL